MKLRLGRLAALAALLLLALPARGEGQEGAAYPSVKLASLDGGLELVAYLPDAKDGYCRSSRFDPSSMLRRVSFAGHRFFGDFISPHDPEATDGASGFAEEYSLPLGYEACEPGGSFLKIGVGVLKRVDGAAYEFGRKYPILDRGVWSARSGASWLELSHEASLGPFAYRLEKRISLEGDAVLVERTLKNLGSAPLASSHYAHNFVMIDERPVGKGYSAAFNFKLMCGNKWDGILETSANGMRFLRDLERSENCGIYPAGCDVSRSGSATCVYNSDSRAGLLVKSLFPVAQCFVFSTGRAVCPESFFAISLKPGESASWSSRYVFFAGAEPSFAEEELEARSLPGIEALEIGGKPFGEFSARKSSYGFALLAGAPLPRVEAKLSKRGLEAVVEQASAKEPLARVSLRDASGSLKELCSVRFARPPVARISCSSRKGMIPESALDGDLETSWSATGDGHWIAFELDGPHDLRGVRIAWMFGDRRKARFDMELSADGESWREVLRGCESSGSSLELETHPFPELQKGVRFLRITGHGNSRGMANNVSEVAFDF